VEKSIQQLQIINPLMDLNIKPSGEWNINWVGLPYIIVLIKPPKAHEILMLISKLMYVEEIS